MKPVSLVLLALVSLAAFGCGTEADDLDFIDVATEAAAASSDDAGDPPLSVMSISITPKDPLGFEFTLANGTKHIFYVTYGSTGHLQLGDLQWQIAHKHVVPPVNVTVTYNRTTGGPEFTW